MPISIPFQSENFTKIPNGFSALETNWDEILHAAVTVGRSGPGDLFRHGLASGFEAMFRWSLVFMSLEQSDPLGGALRRTDAASALDPTEKGAVNYFLGMIICKLFASKLLNTEWLLHLDVFRRNLNADTQGGSRPDLIGEVNEGGQWYVFECKGRSQTPGAQVKSSSKTQASQVLRIGGAAPALSVGAITYFRNGSLNFYWRDPPIDTENALKLSLEAGVWRYYFSPLAQLIPPPERSRVQREVGYFVPVQGLDLEVSIHPEIASAIFRENWDFARATAARIEKELLASGYEKDGLRIRAGKSWSKPRERSP